MKHGYRISVALASMLATACSTAPISATVQRWITPGQPIYVEELRRSAQCGTPDDAAHVHLFADLAAVRAWEQTRNIALTGGEPPLPAQANHPYAVAELGQRNTAGYGLAVSRRAVRQGQALMLSTTFIAPQAGQLAAEVLTSPCVLVSLPAHDYSTVVLVDQNGKTRANSSQEQP